MIPAIIEEENGQDEGCFVAFILTADTNEPRNGIKQWKETTDSEYDSLAT